MKTEQSRSSSSQQPDETLASYASISEITTLKKTITDPEDRILGLEMELTNARSEKRMPEISSQQAEGTNRIEMRDNENLRWKL